MTTTRSSRIRLVFVVQLALGVFMLLVGVVLQPAMPHFQLDAVLTQEQLRDDEVRKTTLEMLERLNETRNDRLLWTIAGAAVTATSVIGLVLSGRGAEAVSPQSEYSGQKSAN